MKSFGRARPATAADMKIIEAWLPKDCSVGTLAPNWNITMDMFAEGKVSVWEDKASRMPVAYCWGSLNSRDSILEDAGAVGAHYTILRMPWEVNPLFQQWLHAHFPDRAQRVMNRIKDIRGGKEYDSDFGKRMTGEGIWADLIRQRFTKTVKRLGLEGRMSRFNITDSSQFRRPLVVPKTVVRPSAQTAAQMDLF